MVVTGSPLNLTILESLYAGIACCLFLRLCCRAGLQCRCEDTGSKDSDLPVISSFVAFCVCMVISHTKMLVDSEERNVFHNKKEVNHEQSPSTDIR